MRKGRLRAPLFVRSSNEVWAPSRARPMHRQSESALRPRLWRLLGLTPLHAKEELMKVWIPVAALAAVLTVTGVASARTDAAPSKRYVVAFTQASGLPADAAQLVANAGGTITSSLPQIGGALVSSSSPGFVS